MNEKEFRSILDNHELYCNTNGQKGEKADLRGADLRHANFENINLVCVAFEGANLKGANLKGANLNYARLQDANLRGANLEGANLEGSKLERADLRNADLENARLYKAHIVAANLKGANLKNADLFLADLDNTNLRNTNFEGAKLNDTSLRGAYIRGAKFPEFQIPQNVELTGWKKLRNSRIAKLRIPAEAKRTASPIGNKCRCEYAEAISIASFDGTKTFEDGQSFHQVGFEYQVGMKIEPDSYNDDIRIECTNGIHFFLDREDAVNY